MKKVFLIAVVLLVAAVVAVSGCVDSGSDSSTDNSSGNTQAASSDASSITVNNLEASAGSYGDYEVTASVTPTKDMDYMEMVLVWYDSSGAVLQKDPLAWNINNAKTGQTIKVKGTSYIDTGEPAKVDVMFFDSVFSDGDESSAIYKKTLTL
ncbi:hypothetical protein [Methanobacterium aggregans]|uniref:hypothetical protein n=1 Tax=Methanobacterium aggregans TaxID=1615586 RepID=UPI001AE8A409|nr:hypothetical protein [Methanobacterium aggregans]MBP2046528.1 FlaG/FlaF family flagellin (archaellin) [Methanobacterium aggregans]